MIATLEKFLPPAPVQNGSPELLKLLNVVYECETKEQLECAHNYLRLWVKRHKDYVIGYIMTQVLSDKHVMLWLRESQMRVDIHLSKK